MASSGSPSGGGSGRATQILVHTVLFIISILVGAGTVVGKIGLKGSDPIVFAFYRESLAAPIVTIWSFCTEKPSCPQQLRRDWRMLLVGGFFMYLSNAAYTVATKVSNPVIGAAWQTTAPVFTAAIAIGLRWEKPTFHKLSGIGIALAGALFIVFFGQTIQAGSSEFVGNVLYFLNVNAYASYGLTMRALLRRHPPLMLTAVSFWIVSVFLGLTTMVIQLLPEKQRSWISVDNPWHMDDEEFGALAYFVIVYSVLMYSAINWANQHVSASTVMSYTVVQPLAAGAVALVLIRIGFNKSHHAGLEEPGWNALGAIGVIGGLMIIIRGEMLDERRRQEQKEAEKDKEDVSELLLEHDSISVNREPSSNNIYQ